MSDGLNRVMLLGNLAADADLRVTRGGQAVLNMRIACNETYFDRNKAKQERVEFASATLWGKRAEALAQYLVKGTRVFVEGSLRTSSYEDRDGNKRFKTEVNVTNVILLGSRSGERQERRREEPSDSGGGGGSYDDFGPPPDDDDIPF